MSTGMSGRPDVAGGAGFLTFLLAVAPTARRKGNTMPYILDAVRAYATVGEICDVFRETFGTYQETSVL